MFKRNQRLIGAKGMPEFNGWKWCRLRGRSCSQVDIIEKVIKIKAITQQGMLEGSCSAARGLNRAMMLSTSMLAGGMGIREGKEDMGDGVSQDGWVVFV